MENNEAYRQLREILHNAISSNKIGVGFVNNEAYPMIGDIYDFFGDKEKKLAIDQSDLPCYVIFNERGHPICNLDELECCPFFKIKFVGVKQIQLLDCLLQIKPDITRDSPNQLMDIAILEKVKMDSINRVWTLLTQYENAIAPEEVITWCKNHPKYFSKMLYREAKLGHLKIPNLLY